MSTPFLSEIKVVSFNFAPKGWALCNGQLMPINQNQPLFSLLGTRYGGDGRVNFALPNLQGRVPAHFGAPFFLGQADGFANVALNVQQLPAHQHQLQASTSATGTTSDPNDAFLSPLNNAYTLPANLVGIEPSTISNVGGGQPHNNMMPYAVLNFVIALQGIYPSRN